MRSLKFLVALTASLVGPAGWTQTPPSPDPAPRAVVDTGAVAGVASGPAAVFRAIPFAAPPVGALRWRPPTQAPAWSGVRAAIAPGPACPQPVTPGFPNLGGYMGATSEDCLTLDVTAPKAAVGAPRTRAPVMVWVYGGGNIAGATNLPSYDAVNFARDGVVVVAMNYRLGPLGFFAHPALTAEAAKAAPLANYGLMDQIAALRWVKRNIAAFGGDPENVTLFGESAGGEDVLQLMATGSARALFKRAIVQSGGGWSVSPSLSTAETRGASLAAAAGLAPADQTAAALRALPVETLLRAGGSRPEPVGPIVDGRLVTLGTTQAFATGRTAAVPLIIGSNSNEATLILNLGGPGAVSDYASKLPPTVRAAYDTAHLTSLRIGREMFNDRAMGAPARWIARQNRAPAWLYYFSYVPERQRDTRPGTNHASEIPFVFDSLDAIPGRTPLITPSERATARLAHACWVAFARVGRPDCGQDWPAYTRATDTLMEFGDPSGPRKGFRKAQLDAQDAAVGPPVSTR